MVGFIQIIGFLVGESAKVHRAQQHVKLLMPSLGLRFSLLEAVLAAGEAYQIDLNLFVKLGCSVNLNQCVEIIKSPIGSLELCHEMVLKRARKAVATVEPIAKVPAEHCALCPLKFQTGRLHYTARTTPPECCATGFAEIDDAVGNASETIMGMSTTESQWAQAMLPDRKAGLGFQSTLHCSAVAYYGSRSATQAQCVAINPDSLTGVRGIDPVVAMVSRSMLLFRSRIRDIQSTYQRRDAR